MWVKGLSEYCSFFLIKDTDGQSFSTFLFVAVNVSWYVCSVLMQDLFLWMSVCADYIWHLCLLFACGKDGMLSLVPAAQHYFTYQPVFHLPACVTVSYQLPACVTVTSLCYSYQPVLQWPACVTVTSLCYSYQPVSLTSLCYQLPACVTVTSYQPVLQWPACVTVTSLCYSYQPVLQLPQSSACVIVSNLCYSCQPVLQVPQLPACVTVTSLCYSYQCVLQLPAWVTITWGTSLYYSYHSYQPVLQLPAYVTVTSLCYWCLWMGSNPSTCSEGWPQLLTTWWPAESMPPTCALSTPPKPSPTTTPLSRSVPVHHYTMVTVSTCSPLHHSHSQYQYTTTPYHCQYLSTTTP